MNKFCFSLFLGMSSGWGIGGIQVILLVVFCVL